MVLNPNLVLNGAVFIIAVNSLLSLNPEEAVDIGRTRFGFRSLMFAKLYFGVVVYFRDLYFDESFVIWS